MSCSLLCIMNTTHVRPLVHSVGTAPQSVEGSTELIIITLIILIIILGQKDILQLTKSHTIALTKHTVNKHTVTTHIHVLGSY